jgi:hypothetical protein
MSGRPQLILVGYTAEAIDNLSDYINAPQPPSNYGEAKQEEWRNTVGRTKLAEAQAESAFCKLTGRVTSIFAVDPSNRFTFISVASHEQSPTVQFLQWIQKNYGPLNSLFPASPEASSLERRYPGLLFFGFDPKQFVRVVGGEAIREGVPMPLGFWYQNETLYDPYDMLVESNRRNLFDLYGLLRLLNVKLPRPDWEPHQDAVNDVQIAAELLFRYQLYPPLTLSVEDQQRELLMTLLREASGTPAPVAEADEEGTAALDPSGEIEQNQTEDAGEGESAEGVDGTEPAPAAPTSPTPRRPSPRKASKSQ